MFRKFEYGSIRNRVETVNSANSPMEKSFRASRARWEAIIGLCGERLTEAPQLVMIPKALRALDLHGSRLPPEFTRVFFLGTMTNRFNIPRRMS